MEYNAPCPDMLSAQKLVEASDVPRIFPTPEGEVRALDGVSFEFFDCK